MKRVIALVWAGAGAVVVKDIPPYAVAVGVPAVVKKKSFERREIRNIGLMKKKSLICKQRSGGIGMKRDCPPL